MENIYKVMFMSLIFLQSCNAQLSNEQLKHLELDAVAYMSGNISEAALNDKIKKQGFVEVRKYFNGCLFVLEENKSHVIGYQFSQDNAILESQGSGKENIGPILNKLVKVKIKKRSSSFSY